MQAGPGTPAKDTSAAISVRVAVFEDFEKVYGLCSRSGQGADSLENWNRLWRDNPAITDGGCSPRIGWVLEHSGIPVGFMGSIPLSYKFRGKKLKAAATCRFAVDPAFRGFGHLLVLSFIRQIDVDLFLNTTATPAAGKIMEALKCSVVPQPEYGSVLLWVIRARKFANSVFHKMGVQEGIGNAGSMIASVALRGDMALQRRVPRVQRGFADVRESGVHELGKEFDEFVRKLELTSTRLMTNRSSQTMRWHFDVPGSKKMARVLTSYSEGNMSGYAVIRHEPNSKWGLKRSVVADLVAVDDNSRVVDQLLSSAYASAKMAGSDILEVMGFPAQIRSALKRHNPYARKYPSCPFYFKAKDRELQEVLKNENSWYACPMDGDATLWP